MFGRRAFEANFGSVWWCVLARVRCDFGGYSRVPARVRIYFNVWAKILLYDWRAPQPAKVLPRMLSLLTNVNLEF